MPRARVKSIEKFKEQATVFAVFSHGRQLIKVAHEHHAPDESRAHQAVINHIHEPRADHRDLVYHDKIADVEHLF